MVILSSRPQLPSRQPYRNYYFSLYSSSIFCFLILFYFFKRKYSTYYPTSFFFSSFIYTCLGRVSARAPLIGASRPRPPAEAKQAKQMHRYAHIHSGEKDIYTCIEHSCPAKGNTDHLFVINWAMAFPSTARTENIAPRLAAICPVVQFSPHTKIYL